VNTLHVSPFGTDKTPMMAHASNPGGGDRETLL